MPLSPPVLSLAIQAGMIAKPACGAVPGPALAALCDAIAEAVVAHILTGAVVTACPAGPGTGVIT